MSAPPQTARTLTERFNFIFIHGNHTYEATRTDLRNAEPLLKPNGIVAPHNASTHLAPDFEHYICRDGGPWRVSQEMKASPSWRFEDEVDRLRVFSRIS